MDAVRPADIGRAKDKRRPFTDDEIRRLAPVIESQRAKRTARYWVSTLLPYTGARLEEIAQLRNQDIFQLVHSHSG
jgi:integrase